MSKYALILKTPTITHQLLKKVVQINFHRQPQKILEFYCTLKNVLYAKKVTKKMKGKITRPKLITTNMTENTIKAVYVIQIDQT